MTALEETFALVCGSTQGIGRACAIALADHGADVTLVARDAAALESVRADLPATGGQVHRCIAVDFRDWEAVRDAAISHVAEHGPAQVLVNNTGGPPAGAAVDGAPSAFADAFAQHLLCNQALVQALVPGMKDAGYGRIVNIISTSVVTPIANLGISNTIRGAVANWGRTLAGELGRFGITVNNVLPGFTDTARLQSLLRGRAERTGTTFDDVVERLQASVPAGRFGFPEEIAAVVAFLASPAAAYVNGVNLPVDGGRLAMQ
jgi:3-oxoacyl-[acyl-carrier protein] reductase